MNGSSLKGPFFNVNKYATATNYTYNYIIIIK